MKRSISAVGGPVLAILATALLTACGGSGDATTAVAVTPSPSPNSAAVTLTGVVSKGALRSAVVKAHPVAPSGAVDTATTLAETLSNDNGQYTLSFSAVVGAPYVVRVSARPAGQTPGTTQLDEISGVTPVADGFALRALFVPAMSGVVNASASVTPFSEFAVAAAEKGSAGVTVGNAAQARVNITALLGFDPTTVTPSALGAAAGSPQSQSLTTMLTAVSKMANDGALGCNQPGLAERVNCVVGRLGSSATLASTKPGVVGGVDVAAALVAAIRAVVAANNLPPTAAGAIIDNLVGAGTPPPVTIGADTQSAIAASKNLFTSLRSDFQAVLGGGANSPVATEADRFRNAMRDVQAPADVLLADAGAILTGLDLYRDFMAGRTTVNSRGRGEASEFVSGGDVNNAGLGRYVTGCSLFADTTNVVRATTPSQVQSIGCSATYFMRRYAIPGGYAVEYWRHGFNILPATTANSFTYTTRARRSIDECKPNCVRTVNIALQTDFYSGTVSVSADSAQRIVGFTMGGALPGAFASGGTALVNERHLWQLNGTRTPGAVRGEDSATVTATIEAYVAGATTPTGTLKLTDGKTSEVAVSRTASGRLVRRGHPTAVADAGGELATADLPIEWRVGAATFVGRLALTDSVWDASGTEHVPTRVMLSGQFRNTNTVTGVSTEFINGNFTVTATGFATFDNTRPTSATNGFALGFQFSGQVTAPGRPTLALTLAAAGPYGGTPTTQTAQYRSLVGGSPTQTISITAMQAQGGARTLSFSEAAADVSLVYVEGAATATLRRGAVGNGTELGTLNTANMLLTFVDGSTMSLDFGL